MKGGSLGRQHGPEFLDYRCAGAMFSRMEIHLSADQAAQLAALAAQEGRSTNALAREAITRFLDEQKRFADAVSLGIAAGDRGEFIAPDEVWAGVERILQA